MLGFRPVWSRGRKSSFISYISQFHNGIRIFSTTFLIINNPFTYIFLQGTIFLQIEDCKKLHFRHTVAVQKERRYPLLKCSIFSQNKKIYFKVVAILKFKSMAQLHYDFHEVLSFFLLRITIFKTTTVKWPASSRKSF